MVNYIQSICEFTGYSLGKSVSLSDMAKSLSRIDIDHLSEKQHEILEDLSVVFSEDKCIQQVVDDGLSRFSFDLLSLLPQSLVLRVLFFTSTTEVQNISLVCRKWKSFIDNESYWKMTCLKNGWGWFFKTREEFPWKRFYLNLRKGSLEIQKLLADVWNRPTTCDLIQ